MKWPEELVLIRHAETTYNASKAVKEASELYRRFVAAYAENPSSQSARRLADRVWREVCVRVASHKTPLTERAQEQAYTTARRLRETTDAPDIVYVSPYDRTQQTFALMSAAWPDLANARQYTDERIREQDLGLLTLYNDRKVFFTLHPEQRIYFEQEGPYYYRYPQGENIPDVRLRIGSWLTTVLREFSERRVWAITHHLTILAARAHLERLGPDEFLSLDSNSQSKPVNCGVTLYRGSPDEGKDGRLRLIQYNQKLYL